MKLWCFLCFTEEQEEEEEHEEPYQEKRNLHKPMNDDHIFGNDAVSDDVRNDEFVLQVRADALGSWSGETSSAVAVAESSGAGESHKRAKFHARFE